MSMYKLASIILRSIYEFPVSYVDSENLGAIEYFNRTAFSDEEKFSGEITQELREKPG